MGHYDNFRELATDLQLDNDDLRDRIKRLERNALSLQAQVRNLLEEKRHLEGNLRGKVHCTPVLRGDEATCDDCEGELDREWTFCPNCGTWIDWDFAHPPEPDWDAMRDAMLDR